MKSVWDFCLVVNVDWRDNDTVLSMCWLTENIKILREYLQEKAKIVMEIMTNAVERKILGLFRLRFEKRLDDDQFFNLHKWRAMYSSFRNPDAKMKRKFSIVFPRNEIRLFTHPVTTITASPDATKPRSLARRMASITRASTSSNQSLMAKAWADERLCCLNSPSPPVTSAKWIRFCF